MPVRPVGAHDSILLAQMGADTHSHGFLADAQVNRTPHFLLAIAFGNAAFDHPDPQHLPVKAP
jgi:hypothetical protein